MIVVDGDHNSTRPRFMFDSVSIFLQACLQIPPEWQLRIHPSMNVTSPPWRYPGAQNSRHSSPTHAMRRPEMHSVTSPTRRSNLDDDSEIDLEEEAAAAIAAGLDFTDDDDNNSGANIDVETLGMTSERQREIEGSLFRMLGHETENEGESGENKEEGANGETAKAPSGV